MKGKSNTRYLTAAALAGALIAAPMTGNADSMRNGLEGRINWSDPSCATANPNTKGFDELGCDGDPGYETFLAANAKQLPKDAIPQTGRSAGDAQSGPNSSTYGVVPGAGSFGNSVLNLSGVNSNVPVKVVSGSYTPENNDLSFPALVLGYVVNTVVGALQFPAQVFGGLANVLSGNDTIEIKSDVGTQRMNVNDFGTWTLQNGLNAAAVAATVYKATQNKGGDSSGNPTNSAAPANNAPVAPATPVVPICPPGSMFSPLLNICV